VSGAPWGQGERHIIIDRTPHHFLVAKLRPYTVCNGFVTKPD
jgi:hypothetical protein